MNLDFQPVQQASHLVPESIYQQLHTLDLLDKVQVAKINPDFADGELLHEQYNVPFESELNCLVVQGKRNGLVKHAAVLVPYGRKANTGSPAKHALDVSKVSFAPLEFVIEQTNMEFGSITPLGLPNDWFILAEASIFEQTDVIIGGGLVKSKLQIATKDLKQIPNLIVVENLAK